MSISERWNVNRHTARCTSLVSVVRQCKPVSGWGLRKRRSAPPWPYGSGTTLLLYEVYVGYRQVSTSLDKAVCSSNVNNATKHESTTESLPPVVVEERDGQQCQDDVNTDKSATRHRYRQEICCPTCHFSSVQNRHFRPKFRQNV